MILLEMELLKRLVMSWRESTSDGRKEIVAHGSIKKNVKSNKKFDVKKLHPIVSLNFDFYVLFSLYSIGRSLANHQQLYYCIIEEKNNEKGRFKK